MYLVKIVAESTYVVDAADKAEAAAKATALCAGATPEGQIMCASATVTTTAQEIDQITFKSEVTPE